MRLIDEDALLEELSKVSDQGYKYHLNRQYVLDLITNAPTVQREGWVSVPIEPNDTMFLAAVKEKIELAINDAKYKKLIMEYKKDIKNEYKAMIQAAPTDTE